MFDLSLKPVPSRRFSRSKTTVDAQRVRVERERTVSGSVPTREEDKTKPRIREIRRNPILDEDPGSSAA